MHHLDPPGSPRQRFPPRPESVASARRFVDAVLAAGAGTAPETADTARLLVSELVTNAVLHARTGIEVSVLAHGGGVRIGVGDHRPGRVLLPLECPAYSGTGQGLTLVARLASRHGVDTGEDAKTVWFELAPPGPRPAPGGWRTAVPPPGSPRTVLLVDVPGALCTEDRQHRGALLRELALAASAGDTLGVPPGELAVAQDTNSALNGWVAAAQGERSADADMRSLPLAVPADAASSLVVLRRVLDLAEDAARGERLLTLPALPRGRAFQRWLLDEIVAQLAGGNPTAWTVAPREPGAGPAELVPWDTRQVRASRVPTIAADEANRIIAVNGPAADLLGWQADELTGRRLTTLIPEHLRKRHIAAYSSLLLTGRARILGRPVPLPALHRDGRLVPVRLTIQTQETTDGRTVFVAQLAPRAAAVAGAPRAPGGSRQPAAPAPAAAGAGPGTGTGPGTGLPALERLSLLADTGNALGNTPDLDEGLQQVGRILTRHLADWCAVDLIGEHARVERVCVVHRRPGGPPPGAPETTEGPVPPVTEDARGPLARVLRGAGPLLLTGLPPLPDGRPPSPLDADYRELFRHLGAGSAVVAPLRARREVLGALTLARTGGGPPFTDDDVSLVDDLVRSLALGVDNARLYQETRNIAERLQRSLLPALPRVGHLELAARYAASSATAQVGGDWYDSFPLPGGDTAVVIGDVSGHNLDAAIAMSQLRSMLRGIAVDRRRPPGAVLRSLDLANHSLSEEAIATCVYGRVTGPPEGPWRLEHSSAGHLPPLLTTKDGATRYLDEGAGLLLGMDPAMPRPSAGTGLPARSTVLLYTDGLIERRDEPLDGALARLRRHTAALAREPLDVFCDELLIGLGADSTDDIAVLAVRPAPPS
ncbi:SpoIIE family protein phosphatase [Streptomyces aidingensis]|uniref:protein-serine/threonine phosphatase n=1 Tax=Streptomyces aidingensis TaxID=910347 RepID=A0A1I1T697_9ACTN|nr:SpoIIE family protein phosphatase [Streptomyces aidingensis]SFD54154.1 PAS domain S-box-containing protein [Streptomyces aidingensis]